MNSKLSGYVPMFSRSIGKMGLRSSPHDKGFLQAIEENLEPWPQAWTILYSMAVYSYMTQAFPSIKTILKTLKNTVFTGKWAGN